MRQVITMKDELEATFKCLNCGGAIIQFPDNPTDDSRVICKSCGSDLGTWGNLKAQIHSATLDVFKEALESVVSNVQATINRR